MLTVKLKQSENKLQIDFHGHAAYAERGKDIVCAAVSALYYTLTEGIRQQAPAAIAVKGESVSLDLSSPAAAAIAKAVMSSLLSIADAYPDHIRLTCPSGIRQ